MKKISLLIPTLGSKPDELSRLVETLNKQSHTGFEAVVVSQGNHAMVQQLFDNAAQFSYQCVAIDRRGLSHARNVAMQHATGDWFLLSDDDGWYPADAMYTIHSAIEKGGAEVFCFRIYDPVNERWYKNYQPESRTYAFSDIGKVSSIEICFSRKLMEKGVTFDERFGLGAEIPVGEENVFLNDALNAGAVIRYVPETIVYHLAKFTGTQRLVWKDLRNKFRVYKRLKHLPFASAALAYFIVKHHRIISFRS